MGRGKFLALILVAFTFVVAGIPQGLFLKAAAVPPVGAIEVLSEGTEHGTSNQCYFNEANGYPGAAGDNGPRDGVVCVGDTVEYKFTITSEDVSTPTVYTFRPMLKEEVLLNGVWTTVFNSLTPSQGAFCAGGTGMPWTGSYSNGLCTLTIPAHTPSATQVIINVPASLTSETGNGWYRRSTQLVFSNPSANNDVYMASPVVKVLTGSYLDVRWDQPSPPTYTTVNGVKGYQTTYPLSVASLFTYEPHRSQPAYRKMYRGGYLTQTFSVDTTLDMGAQLPPGAVISASAVAAGNTAVVNQTDHTANLKLTGTVGGTFSANFNVNVFIPLDEMFTQSTSVDSSFSNTTVLFGGLPVTPIGGMNQPGDSKGKSFNTKTFTNPIYNDVRLGNPYVNNDWTMVNWPPAGGGVPDISKSLDTTSTYTEWWRANNYYTKVGNKVHTTVQVAAVPGSNNTVVFQDRIAGGTAQSLDKVQFTWAGVTYEPSKVEYRQANGTWATTVYVPPNNEDTFVRYTYENVDTDHAGVKGVIDIWVTLNDHPTLPASVMLYDAATVWINGYPSREAQVNYMMAGPYIYTATGAESPTVYAGQTATAKFDNQRSENFGVGLPPGPFTERSKLTISPCLMNVVPPSGFVLTKSPDLGADGLPCTGDDGSGWEFTKTNTFEPKRNNVIDDRTGTNYSFTYTVPAYVPDSTRIPYTSVYGVDGYPTSTANANILVNTTKTFSQMKWTDTPLVQVGENFNWYINWSNGSPTAGSIVVSDNLPTGLTQPIAVSFASGGQNTTVEILKDGVWMPYTTPTVFSAIRFTAPTMAPGSFSVAKLTTSTTGMVDGMKFQNYLNAAPNTVGTNVPQTQPVNNEVWDTKASGVVYWDENKNGTYNSGENPIANATVEVKCTNGTSTVATNAQGVYTVEHIKNGDTCVARVVAGAPANANTSGPTTYTTPAFTVNNKEINDLNFGFTPLLGDATFTYFFSLDGSTCTEASSNCYPVSDHSFTFNSSSLTTNSSGSATSGKLPAGDYSWLPSVPGGVSLVSVNVEGTTTATAPSTLPIAAGQTTKTIVTLKANPVSVTPGTPTVPRFESGM